MAGVPVEEELLRRQSPMRLLQLRPVQPFRDYVWYSLAIQGFCAGICQHAASRDDCTWRRSALVPGGSSGFSSGQSQEPACADHSRVATHLHFLGIDEVLGRSSILHDAGELLLNIELDGRQVGGAEHESVLYRQQGTP